MTTRPGQPDPSAFRSEDEFDEVFAHGNPNPDRIGCPSRDVLEALSKRERPIEDPAYEHLTNCSPCYREFRAFQQARAAATPARRRFWSVVSAAAAVVIVGGLAAWFAFGPTRNAGRPDEAAPAAQIAELHTVLDLQKYTVVRGEQSEKQAPLTLAAARHRLTVLLPVGAEPGSYDVQLLDSSQQSKASTSGEARIRDYVTTLDAQLDASSVPRGEYQLGLRRRGDDWHLYRILIQ